MICTIWINPESNNLLPTPPPSSSSSPANKPAPIPLRFPSYITLSDIQLLIHETFHTFTEDNSNKKTAIGLIDGSKRYYPLSMIKIYPELFSQGVYSIVYLNDPVVNHQLDHVKNENNNNNNNEGEGEEEEEEEREGEGEEDEEDEEELPVNHPSPSLTPQLPRLFLNGYFHLICNELKSRTGLDKNKIGIYLQALSQFSVTNDLISKGRFLSGMVYALHQSENIKDQYTSLPIPSNITAVFEEIFDIFLHESSSSSPSFSSFSSSASSSGSALEIIPICRFLSLFTGGLPNENVKILYYLFDYDQDGFVSFNDLYNCFHELLVVLSHLYSPLFDIRATYSLDTIAESLAQHVMDLGRSLKWENDYVADENEETYNQKNIDELGENVLSLQQFYQWYSNTDNILALPPHSSRASSSLSFTSLASYRDLSAVKKFLSFHPITCSTLKLSLQHYSESQASSFISCIGIFSSIILSFRLHQMDIFSLHQPTAVPGRPSTPVVENSYYLMTMEMIIRHIFDAYDPLHSECVAIEEIFASLSLFLNTSWKERLVSYFQLNPSITPRYQLHLSDSESCCLELQLSEAAMIDYLVSISKTLTLFTSSSSMRNDHEDKSDYDETLLHESMQIIHQALSTGLLSAQPHGRVKLNDFADWLESTFDNSEYDATTTRDFSSQQEQDNEQDEECQSPALFTSQKLSESIQQEMESLKDSLGLIGFTAEDFMDLLGEYANAGTITLSNWLHIVALLNQLNPNHESQSSSQSSSQSQSSLDSNSIAANIFNELLSLSSTSPLSSSQGLKKNDLEYQILLTSLIIFCDSPVEDKIAVIFTVLSQTIYVENENENEEDDEDEDEDFKRVSYQNILFLIQCVLTILSLISPSVREIIKSTNQSTEIIAKSTLQFGIQQNGHKTSSSSSSSSSQYLTMDDFCRLLWTMLGEEMVADGVN